MDLEASHKELETDTHSLLVKAVVGESCHPQGKGLEMRMGTASVPERSWQIRTHFFIHLHLRAFGLGVHLILTGDTDVTVTDAATRIGDSLLLDFSTAGSGERWRLPFGLCPCFAAHWSEVPRPVT